VFDDDERVAVVDETLEEIEEEGDVVEVEACGGFVEDEERGAVAAGEEMADEFEALAFAAGERVEGLAETEVAEADLVEDLEGGGGAVGGVRAFGVVSAVWWAVAEEGDGFGDGHGEDVADAFVIPEDFEGFGAEAGSFAFGAGDEDVAEELHFDFFEASALTARAAAFAGVEGEVAREEMLFGGGGGVCEEETDAVPCAGVDGGGAARRATGRGLIDHDDLGDFFGAGETAAGTGVVFGGFAFEAEEVFVEDLVDEGAFAAAADAGDAAEDA
jgi:hypothetical protein